MDAVPVRLDISPSGWSRKPELTLNVVMSIQFPGSGGKQVLFEQGFSDGMIISYLSGNLEA